MGAICCVLGVEWFNWLILKELVSVCFLFNLSGFHNDGILTDIYPRIPQTYPQILWIRGGSGIRTDSYTNMVINPLRMCG